MDKLFSEYVLGDVKLANRVVMAPMTRSRAKNGDTADDLTAEYYAQRASAGLIITEGSQISVQGQGYALTPGIYNDQQEKGWQRVTQAVHDRHGKIFIQLWHVGRISHTSLQINNASPVSSVAVRAENSTCYAKKENGNYDRIQVSSPKAMTGVQIKEVVEDYVKAAKRARRAGFDGVEIHGANGYLPEQFINGGLNTRSDEYGGSIQNRLRFVLEVVDAIAAEIGAGKTGIRIAPFGRLFDMHGFVGEEETWLALGKELSQRDLAYVHLSDQGGPGAQTIPQGFLQKFRKAYEGNLIVAGGFNKERAESYLKEGYADLIAFGKPYISNPDLVERMQNNWPLTEVDRETVYGGSEIGYTDYKTYSKS